MDLQYFKDTFHLAMNSTKPLYQQLYDYFKRLIVTGVLKEGDQMIPEVTICEEFNLSRSTVRKTMDMLIEDGFIMRRRGKGSFVTNQKLKRNINYLYNFSENMEKINAKPSSIVLECCILNKIDEELQLKLDLSSKNTSVFFLKRLRCANNKPVLCENTYIPYHLCPGIENNDFTQCSLYDVLEKQYLLNLYHATESIQAVFLSEEDKQILKCKEDVPGIKISRISNLDNGEIFEYTTSLTRADTCIFEMDLYKTPNKNSTPIQIERKMKV